MVAGGIAMVDVDVVLIIIVYNVFGKGAKTIC